MRQIPTPRMVKTVERKLLRLTPPQALILSFLALAILGTLLLKLPISTTAPTSWSQAMFTAMSAATVTGLAVVDTGTHFTLFGQVVLLILMQIGGLGLMTFGIFVIYLTSHKLSMGHMAALSEALNQPGRDDMRTLLKLMFGFTLAMEIAGTLLLSLRFVPEMGLAEGLYFSFFHAVSAFNNAGFGLRADNLVAYVGSPLVNVVISTLFITGGIGFVVLADIVRHRRFRRLSLHTKLMLVGTLVVNAIATLAILALEYGNPATLGGLAHFDERLWAAFFQAVAPRTAGFNSVDIGALLPATTVLVMVLMFIGGGSGSTASGIKLSTFIVLLLATRAFLRAEERPTVFGRSLDLATILRAMAIAMLSLLFVLLGIFLVSVSERLPFLDIAFEVVSAFGTVGLSRGITADLSLFGQAVIMALMFVGRIGPLAFAFTLASRSRATIQYPNGAVNIG